MIGKRKHLNQGGLSGSRILCAKCAQVYFPSIASTLYIEQLFPQPLLSLGVTYLQKEWQEPFP